MGESFLIGYYECVNVSDPELEAKTSETVQFLAMMDFEKCITGRTRKAENAPAVG